MRLLDELWLRWWLQSDCGDKPKNVLEAYRFIQQYWSAVLSAAAEPRPKAFDVLGLPINVIPGKARKDSILEPASKRQRVNQTDEQTEPKLVPISDDVEGSSGVSTLQTGHRQTEGNRALERK